MNIKDFLLDNYIWILVVILLSIVTIIGFLADKKKNGFKEKKPKNNDANNQNMQPMNQPMNQPINYQPNNNINPAMNMQQPVMNQNQGMPVNLGEPLNTTVMPQNQNIQPIAENQMITPINQAIAPNQVNNVIPNIQEPISNNNMQPINNFGPTEVTNTMNNVNQEPIYQPLSEQKPVLPPKEITPSNEMNNQFINTTIPQPLEANSIPVQPIPTNPIMNQGMIPPSMNQQINQPIMGMPLEPVTQPSQQNQNFSFQNNGMAPLTNPMNYQHVEPSQPQNIMPEPVQQPIPEPVPTPMTGQPTAPQPINFVYGPPQNNNNQPM